MAKGRNLSSFDVPLDEMCRLIGKEKYESVLLQVPEGLKRGAFSLASEMEKKTGCAVIVDGEPCFGACDHAGERAALIGADAVIHLGHTDIPSMDRSLSVPVHLFRVDMKMDRRKLLKGIRDAQAADLGGKVGLATTAQHIGLLEVVRKELEQAGIEVHIGAPSKREAHHGQVLGCSFASVRSISDDIDSVLFIGSGRFHPLGIVQSTGKVVHSLDPLTGETARYTSDDVDSFLRRRWGAVQKAKELLSKGEMAGIIVCYKPGQRRTDLAGRCLALCREHGIGAMTAALNELSPMKLKSLGPKVWVSTACPRLALEDIEPYAGEGIALITPVELSIVLGKARWEDYRFDEEW